MTWNLTGSVLDPKCMSPTIHSKDSVGKKNLKGQQKCYIVGDRQNLNSRRPIWKTCLFASDNYYPEET